MYFRSGSPAGRRAWAAGLALLLVFVGTRTLGKGAYAGLAWPAAMLVSGAAVVRIHWRLRRVRRELRRPWEYFAGGCAVLVMGRVAAFAHGSLVGQAFPFPSAADPFFLVGYLVLIAGGLVAVKTRWPERDRGAALDAWIIAAGSAVVMWAFVVVPMLAVFSGAGEAVTLAYCVLDLAMVGVTARLAMGGGAKASGHFLFAAMMMMIVAADVTTTLYFSGNAEMGIFSDTTSWLAASLAAVVALHPSISRLAEPRGRMKAARLTLRRIVALAVPTLLPPIVLAFAGTDDRMLVNGVLAIWVVTAALIVVRMIDLAYASERRLQREKLFARASMAFMASLDEYQMYDVAAVAALALAKGTPDARASVLMGSAHSMRVKSSAGHEAEGARALQASILIQDQNPKLYRALLAHQTWVHEKFLPIDLEELVGGPKCCFIVVPIVTHNQLHGAVVVSSSAPIRRSIIQTLESLTGHLAFALDSAQLAEERRRFNNQRRYEALIESSNDAQMILDADYRILYASPAIARLDFLPEKLVDKLVTDLIHPEDFDRLTRCLTVENFGVFQSIEGSAKDWHGNWHAVDLSITNLFDEPSVHGWVLNLRVVDDRKDLDEELTRRRWTDSLTGLPNREMFSTHVRHAQKYQANRRGGMAVLWVDLDKFRLINDALGRGFGDVVLNEVATRLKEHIGPTNMAARISGDDFTVLLEDIEEEAEASATADRLLSALNVPMEIEGREMTLTACIGVAYDRFRSVDGDTLLINAEFANHRAKTGGRGRRVIYVEGMERDATERFALKCDMAKALEAEEFSLEYQPVVDLKSGNLVGLEALARWHHPERGMVLPDAFIPLAEESGFIVSLGRWVLGEAISRFGQLRTEFPSSTLLTMGVNVSVGQLRDDAFLVEVARALEVSKVFPGCISLEVTESLLVEDDGVVSRRLLKLKELGLSLAIDDFGTGYSSLGYLHRFPADTVKIDQCFVDFLGTDHADSGVARAVVQLAHQVGAKVVAEGVELPVQVEALRHLGCDFAQGFYFARPMTFEGVRELLAEGGGTPFAARLQHSSAALGAGEELAPGEPADSQHAGVSL